MDIGAPIILDGIAIAIINGTATGDILTKSIFDKNLLICPHIPFIKKVVVQ